MKRNAESRSGLIFLAFMFVAAWLTACGQSTPVATENPTAVPPSPSATVTRVPPTGTPTATPTPISPTLTPTLSPAILLNRGVDLWRTEDLGGALEAFNQALAQEPDHIDALFERGRVYAMQGNFELAVEDWSLVIELDPTHQRAHFYRAFAYDDLDEYAKAVADYGVVIDTDPQFSEAYFWRGCAYAQLGEVENAIADLEHALELDPSAEFAGDAEAQLDELRPLAAGEVSFDGYWSGNTDQGEIISFEIEGDGIIAYSVGFRIPGCEHLTPFYTHGGGPRALIEGNRFVLDDSMFAITGAFSSSSSAVGTLEVDCEDGLTTGWTAYQGVQAVRTPGPDELAGLPETSIPDDLYARAQGAANFDEYTGIVAENGDWFLLRSFAESMLPIPAGWTAISGMSGADYEFVSEGATEAYSANVRVGRDCTEAETSAAFIASVEDQANTVETWDILTTEVVNDQKGYLSIEMEGEDETGFLGLIVFAKPTQGCFHYLSVVATEEDWLDYYPLFRAIVAHWFDLSDNFLGVELPADPDGLFE